MLLNDFPLIMLRCLACTVVIEGIAAFVLGIRKPADQAVVALANVLTNPPLVVSTTLVSIFLGRRAYIIAISLLEVAAVLIEALVYRSVMRLGTIGKKPCKKLAPLIVSLILNCCSYFGGEILNKFVF